MRLSCPKIMICLILSIFAVVTPLALHADTRAGIVDVSIRKETENLEVSFRIANCFTPKMEEAIQNGIPTTFRIRVTLEKPSLMLVKSPMVDFTVEHTIAYNRLNNEYQVYLQEHPQKTLVTKDFEQAKEWMSTVKSLPVTFTCLLCRDQEYTLKLKAELSKVSLPLILRYIFFWISLWDFETDWQRVSVVL